MTRIKEIRIINADENVFVFNDAEHLDGGTCYNYQKDKIYIARNVFPDEKYASAHPRDIMSVRAVLAHEYYGHRTYRDEYLKDAKNNRVTTPIWQDECRASITAAKITPNLTDRDRSNLIMDSVYRAKEYGQLIELDDFMKEVLYGYSTGEKHFAASLPTITYVSRQSVEGNTDDREDERDMSYLPDISDDNGDIEWE